MVQSSRQNRSRFGWIWPVVVLCLTSLALMQYRHSSTAAEQNKKLQGELKEMKHEVTALRETNSKLSEAEDRLKHQEVSSERNLAHLRTEKEAKEKELAGLAARVPQLEKEIAKQANLIAIDNVWNSKRLYSDFFKDWSQRKQKVNCGDVANCYSAHCYSRTDDKCEDNPWFLRTKKKQPHGEAVCDDQKNPDMPPVLPRLRAIPNEDEGDLAKTQREIQAFKNITAGPFKRWYDWKADCDPDDTHEGKMSGKHEIADDGKTNVYMMRNVCIRPFGKLAGYQPDVHPFEGVDDVFGATNETYLLQHYRDYIANVEPLSEPPRCFLSTNLVLMPIMLRVDNSGHAYHRMAALLDIRKKAYPFATKKDTTTVYVLLEGLNYPEWVVDHDINLSDFMATAFKEFFTVVTGSHFVVAGPKADKHILKRKVFGKKAFADPRFKAPVCFKQVAIYFTATESEAWESRVRPTKRDIVPILHYRSTKLLDDFNSAMRHCAGAAPRRLSPELKNPNVLLALRSGKRRWTLSPRVVSLVGDYFTSVGANFHVHEMKDESSVDLAGIYGQFDIVLGSYGAGLFYGMYMSPGSVVAELNFPPKRCSGTNGIDHPDNRWCDYGGSTWSLGIHHVVTTFGTDNLCGILQRGPWTYGEWEMNPEAVVAVAEAAYCALTTPDTAKPQLPGGVAGVAAECNESVEKAIRLQGDPCALSWKPKYQGVYNLLAESDKELREEFGP